MVESDYSYMAKKRVELGEEARTIVCLEVIDLGLVFLGGGAGLARELTKLTRKVNGFPLLEVPLLRAVQLCRDG